MKNDTTEFKIKDEDMIVGALFTHGTQTVELKYFNSTEVKLYDAAEDWTLEERRNYFQRFYSKKL